MDEFEYTQEFNGLASSGLSNAWSNNTTLPGWYATEEVDGDYTIYAAGTGSSGTTRLYSFGTGSGDRALGSLNQNDSETIAYGILFDNSTGLTLNSITLAFTVEQWRRSLSSTKGHQRVKVGYQISNVVDVSSSGILNGSFEEIPEAYMITLDTITTTPSSALDGNALANHADVSVIFPVTIPDGDQIFIRFLDENVSGVDMALAIDGLSITFSSSTVTKITATSDYDIFQYLNQGMIEDIPDENAGIAYIKMDDTSYSDWVDIMDDFYSANYGNIPATADLYNYRLVDFFDQTNSQQYRVLRNETTGTYRWGIFVTEDSPNNDCLNIQAPHPIKDTHTGNQAAGVYRHSEAYALMIAGISRCTHSEYTLCDGETAICGSTEQYRISDVAHNDSTVFHIATLSLANSNTSSVFLQLHGFSMEPSDPHFIISNGSDNNVDVPNPDYAVNLQTEIETEYPTLDAAVIHADGFTELTAFKNIQGRHLNNYPSNICTSSTKPASATGRFIHIEQYFDYREQESNYTELAQILTTSVDCSIPLPVTFVSFTAHELDKSVFLEWVVAKETNHSHYEIERSNDGTIFKSIALVRESIIDKPRFVYRFIDKNPLIGDNYYRIKQVDDDGHYQYHGSQFISMSNRNIFLYPNPTERIVSIGGLSSSFQLVNFNGQVVKPTQNQVGNKVILNLSKFPSGIYFLHTGKETVKIIKK